MRILFLRGLARDVDDALISQIQAADAAITCQQAANADEALVEIWKGTALQAVVISPQVSRDDTISLIGNLRHDRVPLAIVPIVAEAQRETLAAAVAAGADDVLLTRDLTLLNLSDTLGRIRQSPHLYPSEQHRRLRALYAGRDPLVWSLLEQVPFVAASRVEIGIDGFCQVRSPGTEELRCDMVVIDEQPDDAHPLQVVKSVKSQAPHLPVIVLTSLGTADIGTAALELGADDTVLKSGIFRRRLIATLRRALQRLELDAHHSDTRTREQRLRQIVEQAPCSLAVIGGEGVIVAINEAGIRLLGAERTREVVGRDFRAFVGAERHDTATAWLHTVTRGESSSLAFEAETLTGARVPLVARAAPLERDSRGNRGMIVTFEAPAGARTRADETPLDTRLDEAHQALNAARDAHAAEIQRLHEQLRSAQDAVAGVGEWQERAARAEEAERHAERELVVARESWRATEEALGAATSQLSEAHAHVQQLEHGLTELRHGLDQAERNLAAARVHEEASRAARHELELLRGLLAAERQELDRVRLALEVAQAELHHTDQARAADRAAWTAAQAELQASLHSGQADLERERAANQAERAERLTQHDAAIDAERQEWQQTVSAFRADHAAMAEALAAERLARDREGREIEKRRAAFDREEAMTAARETRMVQAQQAAIADLQQREAELMARCGTLQAALAESERGRREAEASAEPSRQTVPAPSPEHGSPLLEDTGALAAAMLPTLESLVSTLRDDERQLRSMSSSAPHDHRGRYGDVVTQLGVLIRQLATFSRHQPRACHAVDLNTAISQAQPMLAHLVGPYVGFEVQLGPAAAVDVPQSDLDQLLTSLVTFGRDVLPAGGTLILETSPARNAGPSSGASGARLRLMAMGYGARCPSEAPAVALSARRCGAELVVRGDQGWRAELEVIFSAFADGRRRPWTWSDDDSP